jgi:hypothetical protein
MGPRVEAGQEDLEKYAVRRAGLSVPAAAARQHGGTRRMLRGMQSGFYCHFQTSRAVNEKENVAIHLLGYSLGTKTRQRTRESLLEVGFLSVWGVSGLVNPEMDIRY